MLAQMNPRMTKSHQKTGKRRKLWQMVRIANYLRHKAHIFSESSLDESSDDEKPSKYQKKEAALLKPPPSSGKDPKLSVLQSSHSCQRVVQLNLQMTKSHRKTGRRRKLRQMVRIANHLPHKAHISSESSSDESLDDEKPTKDQKKKVRLLKPPSSSGKDRKLSTTQSSSSPQIVVQMNHPMSLINSVMMSPVNQTRNLTQKTVNLNGRALTPRGKM